MLTMFDISMPQHAMTHMQSKYWKMLNKISNLHSIHNCFPNLCHFLSVTILFVSILSNSYSPVCTIEGVHTIYSLCALTTILG